jgi:putative transposase
MKKRHEAQEVIRILRDIEAGPGVPEGLKKHGISEQTYYRWKKQYGALPLDEAKRLKQIEQENARLKKVVAEQAVMIDILREITGKKS